MVRIAGESVARAYMSAGRWRARLLAALGTVYDGIWLGLMDREALAAVDAAYYRTARERVGDQSSAYVDDVYNAQGLYEWEQIAVDRHFAPGSRVVVTGAGAGREVIGLLERGYDASGYEPHDDLRAAGIDFASRAGHENRIRAAARDLFPTTTGRCDAVVVGWGSYMLIPGKERRIAFLRAAQMALPPGGPLLLSFLMRGGDRRYFKVVHAIASSIRWARGAEPAELGDALGPNFAHLFTQAEVEHELREAGFAVVAFEGKPYPHAVARTVTTSEATRPPRQYSKSVPR